ncbi:hypothetical protein ACFL08_05595 [Patescibacteria group bacterium]
MARTIYWPELLVMCGGDFWKDKPNLDMECLKEEIQPGDNNPDKREWSPASGRVYVTSDRKAIVVGMTFDQESIDILRVDTPSIAYSLIGSEKTELGLEVELLADTGFNSSDIIVYSEGPEMRPIRDSEALDEDVPDGQFRTIAQLLWRKVSAVEKDREYKVVFFFKEPIPEGVKIRPQIQLSIDTQLLCRTEIDFLVCSDSDWIDCFGIESSFYAYPNGFVISSSSAGGDVWCWDNKTDTGDYCSGNDPQIEDAIDDTSSAIGVFTAKSSAYLGSGKSELPTEDNNDAYPDFIVTDVELKTVSGEEKYTWDKSEELYIHAWVDNIGDADWEGDHDDIEIRYYLSQGYKEDLHSEWERVGIDTIQKYNLDVSDDPKHEDDRLILLNKDSIQPGNYYNIVVCADRTVDQDNGDGDVIEMHRSNNCSTEAVFYVDEPAPPASAPLTDEQIIAIFNLIVN